MALVNCKECGKEISANAAVCPHCGFKKKEMSGCALVIAGLFIFVVASMVSTSVSTPPKSPAADLEATARGLCRAWILDQLNDPGSAEFEHSSTALVTHNNDTWTVLRPLRAKNGFGGLIKTSFVCTMTRRGNSFDKVRVTEIGKP